MTRTFAPAQAAAEPVQVTAVRAGLLQRACACGQSAASGECSACAAKKQLQRSGARGTGAGKAPPLVDQALRSSGEPLDAETRSFMESRFGHSFGAVRVHHDSLADRSARAVGADAFTVGRDVVFTAGRYAPRTAAGRHLLAHELTHVVQQGGSEGRPAGGLSIGAPGTLQEAEADQTARAVLTGGAGRASKGGAASLQRQPQGEEEKKLPEPAPAPAPAAAQPAPAAPVAAPAPTPTPAPAEAQPAAPSEASTPAQPVGRATGTTPQLQLDPEIEARMRLMTRNLLDPGFVRSSLGQLDFNSILGAPPPPWMKAPLLPAPSQLVPAGPGPGTPRPASMGDLLKGIMKVPAVDSVLTSLQSQAGERVRRDWSSLSTGGKVALVTDGAVIAGGTLAGILASPDARQFTLDLLQNRTLPTGVSGLDFKFNLTGPDQRIQFYLNVGQMLPGSWGFH